MDGENNMRRRSPRQERGRQRVALLLDAAEELFGEAGYEGVSTPFLVGRVNDRLTNHPE